LILTRHYRGDAETALRAAEAEASLYRLHYRSEAVFPFERYITRMSECFELMEDNQQGFSEPQKVKKMLDGIVSTNAEVVAIKAVVHSTHPNDFNRASNLMAGQIALLFPAATSDLRNKRKISAVAQGHGGGPGGAGGRGGRHGGRMNAGRGSGGRHGNTQFLNGVDDSDPMRTITINEWKKLRESGFLSWLIDRRSSLNNRRGGGGGRGFHRGGRGGGRGGEQGRGISAVLTGTTTEVEPTSTITDSAGSGGSAKSNVGGRAGV
jgi:hypothetical protein